MSGPGYGLDTPTYPTVYAGVYALYVYLGVAFMVTTLVVRHTRADEETGRAELLGSSVVGRYAPLAAAGVVTVAASVLVGLGVTAATWSYGQAAGAWLAGASAAAVGLSFAGIAAVAAQVAERARTATAFAATAIGAAVVVRGVGDILREHGSWLSWFSPLAWSQQTRVFVDGRWSPLTLSAVLCVVGFACAALLLARRDLGAGLVAQRAGHARAAAWMRGPVALALRLERGSMVGWTLGVGFTALLYGSLATSVRDSLGDLPDNLRTVLLAQDGDLVDGYAATMALFNALLVASFAIVAVRRLAHEEEAGRAEEVLAGAVSRSRWVGSALVTSLAGAVLVSAVAGVGLGWSVAASLGEPDRFWPLVWAQLAYVPAVAVGAGFTALLVGWRPRWSGAAWFIVVWGMFAGFFGQLIDLPGVVSGLSPFEHVARMPVESVDATALVWLMVAASALSLGAVTAFRRRDVPA